VEKTLCRGERGIKGVIPEHMGTVATRKVKERSGIAGVRKMIPRGKKT